MFGIGWAELLVIVAVLLVVVKPEQLPQTARKFGQTYRQLRKAITDSTTVLESEVEKLKTLDRPEVLKTPPSKARP